MSPEQCEGRVANERSDLYSLGCVLYALLTGHPPFHSGQPLAIMLHHLNTPPVGPKEIRADVPAELNSLVLNLLAKKLENRPPSAKHVSASLQAIRRTPTINAYHAQPAEPSRPVSRQPQYLADRDLTVTDPFRAAHLPSDSDQPTTATGHVAGRSSHNRMKAAKVIYVAGDNKVYPITLPDGTPGTPIAVGAIPAAIAITPDGTTAYVVSFGDNTVTPISIATGIPGWPIPVGDDPLDIAITLDGTAAYVANQRDGTVTPISLVARTSGTPIKLAVKSLAAIAITPDGTTAYVAGERQDFHGQVIPISLPTGTPGKAITVGNSLLTITIAG